VKEVLEKVLTECRSYTARDLEEHYVLCGHRMLGQESKRVLDMIGLKYEHNPTINADDKGRRLRYVQKRREWDTQGMYPDVGQPLMEKFVLSVRH
jgi:hypothetical protein